MKRREFLKTMGYATAMAALGSVPKLAWADEKSKLKITDVRLVKTRPKRPYPDYTAVAGVMGDAERRGLRATEHLSRVQAGPQPLRAGPALGHDHHRRGDDGQGHQGLRGRRPRRGPIVLGQFKKLMLGRDPFDLERNWDINWRATESYGQEGVTMNAISGFDNACWDIVGKALGVPIYELLGGETKPRIPVYCTGNDIEQHVEHGFKGSSWRCPLDRPAAMPASRAISIWWPAPARRSASMAT